MEENIVKSLGQGFEFDWGFRRHYAFRNINRLIGFRFFLYKVSNVFI
jgi:hypothetical protein